MQSDVDFSRREVKKWKRVDLSFFLATCCFQSSNWGFGLLLLLLQMLSKTMSMSQPQVETKQKQILRFRCFAFSFVLFDKLFLYCYKQECYLLFDQDFFLTFGIINCFQPLTQVWCTCVKTACTTSERQREVSTVNSKQNTFFHNEPFVRLFVRSFFLLFVTKQSAVMLWTKKWR